MIHRHHITPRFERGSDDESNLVDLSVVQHAMWHFADYQRTKDPRHLSAWKGLKAVIDKPGKNQSSPRKKRKSRVVNHALLKVWEEAEIRWKARHQR